MTDYSNILSKLDGSENESHHADSSEDRREHFRFMTVMRVARLANQEIEGLGVVRNVSEGGMMIDAHVPVEMGQRVTIAMVEDHHVSGEVAWKDDDVIGVRFDGPVDLDFVLARPSVTEDGKRIRLPRLTVNELAQIQIGAKKLDVKICDVSQRGTKIQCQQKLLTNEQILILLPNRRNVRGTVKWQTGEYAGVEFHRLLAVDELAQWLPVSKVQG